MTTDTDIEQTTELALQQSRQLLEEVTACGITSVEQYRNSSDLLQRVKTRQKEVEGERKGILRPFDEARDRIMKLFAPVQKNLADAERLLKASMIDWTHKEEERVRQEEEAAREARRVEQERLTAQAEAAETAGDETKATVLSEMAQDVPLQTAAPVERAAGTSVRQIWRAEVTDKRALLQGALLGRVSLDAVEFNMPFLNQLAHEKKDTFDVPGAKAVMEEVMAVRTA